MDYRKKYKTRYTVISVIILVLMLILVTLQILSIIFMAKMPGPTNLTSKRLIYSIVPIPVYICCILTSFLFKYKEWTIDKTIVFVYINGKKIVIGVDNAITNLKYSDANRYYKIKVKAITITIDLKKVELIEKHVDEPGNNVENKGNQENKVETIK